MQMRYDHKEQEGFSMLFEANPHGLCHLGLFVITWPEIIFTL